MRRIGIEIAGDYNSTAIKEATAALENMDAKVIAGANKSIERLAVQRTKLEQTAAAYSALAATAEKGSAQQVAAADLAARAQKRLGTEVLATNAAIRNSAKKTALEEREAFKFARGGISNAGSFGKAGLGLALGSGGFLLGAAFTGGIKVAIDAAKQLKDAEEQLAVAVDNSGLSYDRSRKQLENYVRAESAQSVFTRAQLTTGLIGLVRATGSVTKAEKDETLAANIARGAHIDLGSATQDLINLEGGRTRGLVTLGVKIPIVKTATDALRASGLLFTGQQKAEAAQLDKNAIALEGRRILLQKYAGATKAFSDSSASATDKLKKSANDLATAVGGPLLTALGKVEVPLAGFLSDLASGKGSGLGAEIHSLADAIDKVAGSANHALKPVGGFFGLMKWGFENLPGVQALHELQALGHSIDKLTGGGGGGKTPGNAFVGSPVNALGVAGGGNSTDYFKAVLAQLGIKPTAANIAFLNSWAHREGVPQGVDPFNMLGTTLQVGGSHGTNGPGVQAYGSFADGVKATALMLAQGNFTGIRGALASGNPGAFSMSTELQKEFRSWSGGGYSWPSASGGAISLSGAGSSSGELAALLAQGKPKKGKGFKIPDALEAKIRLAQQTFADSMTRAHLDTLDGLLKQEETLLKSHHELAKAQSVANEITKADTQFTKALAAHVKAQIQAVTSSFASVIATDKQAITSAMSGIIGDAQTAFSAATQDYITNTLGPKFSQGGLLTAKEQQYADMQAADTAKSLVDGLTAAQKTLADDMNGSLIEHIVDISTGATKNIYGPQGTPEQVALDKQAVDQAQRMIDENDLSIAATAQRKDADKAYADAVTQYQQERADAEHAMTRALTDLGRGISLGTASINDLPGVLAQYGLSSGAIESSSAGQFSDDMAALGTATQALAAVMIQEALALNKLGDSRLASQIAAAAQAVSGLPAGAQGTATPGGVALGSYYGVGSIFNPTQYPRMATGGDILRDGLIYAHRGERVQPAHVVRGTAGGDGLTIIVNAPNYVGSHDDLVAALKHASVSEGLGAAVTLSSRRGHLRTSDIRS